ncbi:MAG: hypothetical protein ACOYY3_19790 [Chloroflexota bacterium]
MARRSFWTLILFALLTGCATPAPAATPTPAPLPTEPPPSPTLQPTATDAPPTFTLEPSPTVTLTPLPPTGISTPSLTPTSTLNIFYGSSDYNKRDDWATLKLENNSGQEVKVKIGGPNFYTYITFKIDTIIEVPWGAFWYEAYIGKNGPFSGGFSITNSDKHVLVFENNKIRFLVP